MWVPALLLILAAILYAWERLKNSMFKATDASLVKEDQTLKNKQDNLDTQIADLKKKMEQPTKELNPQEIEVYWSKK